MVRSWEVIAEHYYLTNINLARERQAAARRSASPNLPGLLHMATTSGRSRDRRVRPGDRARVNTLSPFNVLLHGAIHNHDLRSHVVATGIVIP